MFPVASGFHVNRAVEVLFPGAGELLNRLIFKTGEDFTSLYIKSKGEKTNYERGRFNSHLDAQAHLFV
jgi:hypothetical protein